MSGDLITGFASLLVASIAAASAYASQRAASKATTTSSRTDAEKDAYTRARAFDTDTIERQEEELAELRTEKDRLKARVRSLEVENADLSRKLRAVVERIQTLERERGTPPPWIQD